MQILSSMISNDEYNNVNECAGHIGSLKKLLVMLKDNKTKVGKIQRDKLNNSLNKTYLFLALNQHKKPIEKLDAKLAQERSKVSPEPIKTAPKAPYSNEIECLRYIASSHRAINALKNNFTSSFREIEEIEQNIKEANSYLEKLSNGESLGIYSTVSSNNKSFRSIEECKHYISNMKSTKTHYMKKDADKYRDHIKLINISLNKAYQYLENGSVKLVKKKKLENEESHKKQKAYKKQLS